MDNDDYRALIDILKGQLRAAGAGEIADDRHYLFPDPNDGEPRLMEPLKQLTQMLAAFERKLAMEDRQTFERALGRMNEVLRGERINGAEYIPARDGDREPRPIDLARAADLTQVREGVQHLIGRLQEIPLPPRRLG